MAEGDTFNTILMQTRTPRAADKVLLWQDGMTSSGGGKAPSDYSIDNDYRNEPSRSPGIIGFTPHSNRSSRTEREMREVQPSEMSYPVLPKVEESYDWDDGFEDDDVASNIQEQPRSIASRRSRRPSRSDAGRSARSAAGRTVPFEGQPTPTNKQYPFDNSPWGGFSPPRNGFAGQGAGGSAQAPKPSMTPATQAPTILIQAPTASTSSRQPSINPGKSRSGSVTGGPHVGSSHTEEVRVITEDLGKAPTSRAPSISPTNRTEKTAKDPDRAKTPTGRSRAMSPSKAGGSTQDPKSPIMTPWSPGFPSSPPETRHIRSPSKAGSQAPSNAPSRVPTQVPSQAASRPPPSGPTASQRAPSAVPSQPANSHVGHSKAGSIASIPTTKDGIPMKKDKDSHVLHPLTSHSHAGGSRTGGSRYAGSAVGTENVKSPGRDTTPLHPLTAHQRSIHGASSSQAGSQRVGSPPGHVPYTHVVESVDPNGHVHSITYQEHLGQSDGGYTPVLHHRDESPAPSHVRNHAHDAYDLVTPMRHELSLVEEEDEGEVEMTEKELMELLKTPKTNRTSYTMTPSALAADVHNSKFHDEDLCILLHAADDDTQHEVVKRAVRKAVKSRLKKLEQTMRNKVKLDVVNGRIVEKHIHDPEEIMDRDEWLEQQKTEHPYMRTTEPPPVWAKGLIDQVRDIHQRLDELDQQASMSQTGHPEHNAPRHGYAPETVTNDQTIDYDRVTNAATVPIYTPHGGQTQLDETSTILHGMGDTVHGGASTHHHTMAAASIHRHDGSHHGTMEDEDDVDPHRKFAHTPPAQDDDDAGASIRVRQQLRDYLQPSERGDSPGVQYYEEELYKLRAKPAQSERSHRTWEIAPGDGIPTRSVVETEMPEIPDSSEVIAPTTYYQGDTPRQRRAPSPLPIESSEYGRGDQSVGRPGPSQRAPATESQVQPWSQHHQGDWPPGPPKQHPWNLVHQRLLNWAIVWPVSELEKAFLSTEHGHQIDEVALSIWSTQVYKRYMRATLMASPPGRVDRLFVPPNMADAINNAVFNGRHGDACGMLRDLWTPFGLDGIPRIIVVLARHRREEDHWVVHRFSLPDGTLITYDTFPGKALPDGRPLGWWFAIKMAWPNAMYPSPDHLVQRIMRLHRPNQAAHDNSVAAAAIWRNLVMGAKAERTVDLERMRELISQEVRNLRQRKELGKLSVGTGQQK